MKALVLILSIIILGLSCLPCTDGKDVAWRSEGKYTQAVVVQSAGDTPHSDFCTPFCSCSCCGVQISSVKMTGIEVDLPIYKLTHNDTYLASPLTPLPAIIWQPPQLHA
ncbi:MAG: hypothetical protein EOO03_18375 [Chitinophagaceae bacterium]|nr:MAG: hypothetical protein EOO03_18375 [Chitinophagaceae bacterium]